MKKKSDETTFVRGSGNVYADLGLPQPEIQAAKAELVRQIAAAAKKKKLTQVRIAKILRIDQPKVSALLKGRFGGFSIDRLLRFLALLNQDVTIEIKPKRGHAPGRIAVAAKGRC